MRAFKHTYAPTLTECDKIVILELAAKDPIEPYPNEAFL